MNSIWWIRRDLRLFDNQALQTALQDGRKVVPLFILDPEILTGRWHSPKRESFLWQGLSALSRALEQRGSYLLIRQGRPVDILSRLLHESQADCIVAEADFSPYARRRDRLVNQTLPLNLVAGSTVIHPDRILTKDGGRYTVFTPFRKTWQAQALPGPGDLIPIPDEIPSPPPVRSDPLPANSLIPKELPFVAGEDQAQKQLERFTQGPQAAIWEYAQKRNRPDQSGTSGLSPYLRFGMLSARQAVVQARESAFQASNTAARQGAETWLSELIWREFFIYVLYHFPHVLRGNFRPEYDTLAWREAPMDLEAWYQGQTGFPIVDAGMRQLAVEGWMHNRVRMIVASFLCKDLLINWRHGESWFMQHLVDGDPAANNGGWQWCAGTGTDAAPYFRIFNPTLQSQKFDPLGDYIRQWVPELTRVPPNRIHAPWEMSSAEQKKFACQIGVDYPAPIVDHQLARQRALSAYAQARDSYLTEEEHHARIYTTIPHQKDRFGDSSQYGSPGLDRPITGTGPTAGEHRPGVRTSRSRQPIH